MSFDLLSLIEKKRDQQTLSKQEIQLFVESLISRKPPPDYQISAFLAFCLCRGLDDQETADLTEAMENSGEPFGYEGFPKGSVYLDKHSTGGVGDKFSIPLFPLVVCASQDVFIPSIAGRGLGHTGGTIDKLESIPGFETAPSPAQFKKILLKHRFCLTGQSKKIAPADRILYAMRDVSGTVPSIPLITASILSKKLSERPSALVFDVKFGSGAFMREQPQALQLAESLLRICKLRKKPASALVTNMNSPLGHYSGNLLEIRESLDLLLDQGPSDAKELLVRLAQEMLKFTGLSSDEAKAMIHRVLQSGEAFHHFKRYIEAQGGSFLKLEKKLKSSNLKVKVIAAKKSGCLSWNVYELGMALVELGGGRKTKDQKIDYEVGFFHPIKHAERVEKGQEILSIFYRNDAKLENCLSRLRKAFQISDESFSNDPLVLKVLK